MNIIHKIYNTVKHFHIFKKITLNERSDSKVIIKVNNVNNFYNSEIKKTLDYTEIIIYMFFEIITYFDVNEITMLLNQL